jgi:hypothetical protein
MTILDMANNILKFFLALILVVVVIGVLGTVIVFVCGSLLIGGH